MYTNYQTGKIDTIDEPLRYFKPFKNAESNKGELMAFGTPKVKLVSSKLFLASKL